MTAQQRRWRMARGFIRSQCRYAARHRRRSMSEPGADMDWGTTHGAIVMAKLLGAITDVEAARLRARLELIFNAAITRGRS